MTYRISDLSPDILKASEAVIVTRVEDRQQALALLALASREGMTLEMTSEWLTLLADLAMDEAVLVAGPGESTDSLKRFRVAARLTRHVRHRQKYADVPVWPGQEFVFTRDGRPTGERARTVQDLISSIPSLPDDVVQGHLRRGDFRRWIEDVFGDIELGGAIYRLEREEVPCVRDALLRAVAGRYAIGLA